MSAKKKAQRPEEMLSPRDAALQLRISFPKETGPFPVVVWSHGAGGSKDNYTPLVEQEKGEES